MCTSELIEAFYARAAGAPSLSAHSMGGLCAGRQRANPSADGDGQILRGVAGAADGVDRQSSRPGNLGEAARAPLTVLWITPLPHAGNRHHGCAPSHGRRTRTAVDGGEAHRRHGIEHQARQRRSHPPRWSRRRRVCRCCSPTRRATLFFAIFSAWSWTNGMSCWAASAACRPSWGWRDCVTGDRRSRLGPLGDAGRPRRSAGRTGGRPRRGGSTAPSDRRRSAKGTA